MTSSAQAARETVCIAATFLFNFTSSIFFFASVHSVIPIYANGLPPWLIW